ncbi:MAG: M14 family zinc carboxypeptidase [Candidatus Thermoplasmatota archaeon]
MNKKIVPFILFFLLLFSSCVGAGFFSSQSSDPTMLVRVDLNAQQVVLPRGVEIASMVPESYVDIFIQQSRLSELREKTSAYRVLIEDVDLYSSQFIGQYHTLAQIEQILADTAASYPSITKLTSIGSTYEGRNIYCLEISDNPGVDEEEPGVLFMGLHHAREWPTVEICLYILSQLTSQYGSDSMLTNLVDTRRVWIVPCVNPDGYYYCHDQGHDWRKNRQYFSQFGTIGVDLNRNYDGTCNGEPRGAWGSVMNGAATHSPNQETYCGPAAFSEYETQAIQNMFLTNDICASISWHTYSELVLWPWGYATNEQTPDNTYLKQVGQGIAARITKQSGSGTYTPQQSAALYPTTGDTDDWAYGYAHYIQGRNTFAYTIEACSQFQPPAFKLDQICTENFDGALFLLQEAANISALIPRPLPPVLTVPSSDPDGNYLVSWTEQNPAAGVDCFQLDELSRFHVLVDDAESSEIQWNLIGFTKSSDQMHSGAQSYKAKNQNNYVSSMTSNYAMPVTSGMILSFWTWYSIENQWDYAFVEVSRDGRKYDVLDAYTGSSSGWVQKQYDLSSYADSSIFIRFRYTTDDETVGSGFYVDDISPVPVFDQSVALSDTIGNTSFEVSGKANGTYYYRVRAHNTVRGWGDYSMLQKILVGSGEDTQPPSVQIMVPAEKKLYLGSRMFPFFATLVIGSITVEVSAVDASGIDRVEFYLDGIFVGNDTEAPYTYAWVQKSFGKHVVAVIAVDTYANQASQEIVVWKFF